MKVFRRFDAEVVRILKRGGVGVIPTDTMYGVVGSARNSKTVGRIYALRDRNARKPMIVLIGSSAHLAKFGVKTTAATRRFLEKFWPGKVSVILRVPDTQFAYLHRGTKSIAFRVPKDKHLQELLTTVGPLVAPSANTEGNPPATTIAAARKYFGEHVDFYIDLSKRESPPSTLVKLHRGKPLVVRSGATKIR